MTDSTTTSELLQTIFIGGQLLLLGFAAVFGWKQLSHARRLRDEQARPFVVVELASSRPKFFDLVVKNVGSTLARNVTFEIDPPMETSKKYIDIYRLKAFNKGISTLPPGNEFRTLLDFAPSRHEEELPDFYRVTVRYQGEPDNRAYKEEFDLDFGLYWNRMSITVRDIHDVHEQLEIIATEVQRWRPGFGSGLLAVSPNDVQARQQQVEQELEEYRVDLDGSDRDDAEDTTS